MKNILFFGPSISYNGAIKVMVQIINSLEEEDYDCHLVLIAPFHEKVLSNIQRSVTYHDFTSLSKFYSKHLIRKAQIAFYVKKLINEYNIDCLVVGNRLQVYTTLVFKALGLYRIPVISRWGTIISYHIKARAWIERYCVKFLMKYADLIVPPSEMARRDLLDNSIIDEKNVRVVLNPIDFDHINMLANKDSIETGSKPGKLVIVYLGALSSRKDPMTLVKAILKIKKEEPDIYKKIEVLIIGDGSLKSQIQKLVDLHDMNNCVNLLGYSENPFQLLKNADLFVHTSRMDGFALALVEAAYFNTRILYADGKVGVLEEMKKHSIGEAFDPGDHDQLGSLILSEYARKSSQRTPHAFLELFSPSNFSNNYNALISEIISKNE